MCRRSWPMLLLLDACKYNGATCCENDSMFLLHFPLPSLAAVTPRWVSYASIECTLGMADVVTNRETVHR